MSSEEGHRNVESDQEYSGSSQPDSEDLDDAAAKRRMRKKMKVGKWSDDP
jgi:hypothetical protein